MITKENFIHHLLKGEPDQYHTAAMQADISGQDNWGEAARLIPVIHNFMVQEIMTRTGEDHDVVTFDEIYMKLGCGDIPLYIAVHLLVINDTFLCGQSPYLIDGPECHTDMTFTLRAIPCPTCKRVLVDGVTMELMGHCVSCEYDAFDAAMWDTETSKDG